MTDRRDPLAGRLLDEADERVVEDIGKQVLEELAAEFAKRGYSPRDIGLMTDFRAWDGLIKNSENEAEIHRLSGLHFAPSWETGPAWPVITPGPAVRVTRPRSRPQQTSAPCVVVWPDMQIGFFRDALGGLQGTHDEAAIEVALIVTALAKPSKVVLLGDNLDLPEFSKYRLSPAFQATTQATIDYATQLMGRLRATVGPECEIVWIAGNHEERLPNFVLDNAKAAFGLRQGSRYADRHPSDWPVLSVPHLCRLDDHDVRYLPGYPAGHHWVTPRLKIIHGTAVKSRGSTAHVYLDREKTSVIYGHIHRIERAHRTRDDHDGKREVMAASPGCLARIDGVVPSTKQGLDLDGRPLSVPEDWQQGLAVIPLFEDGYFDYEQVRIDSGVGFWRGQRIDP